MILLLLFFNIFQNDYQSFKTEMLAKVNQIRIKGCDCGEGFLPGAPPLTWNDKLAFSAADHAIDMYQNGYFSHKNRLGQDSGFRAKKRSFDWRFIAENIAMGHENVDEVVKGWFESPSHCKNLMNPNLTMMGAAKKGQYWVQDLGTPKNQNQSLVNVSANLLR